MITFLKAWDYEMAIDSIGATVYQYWQLFFYSSLFKKYSPKNDPEFGIMIAENSVSKQFFQRFFKDVESNPKGSRYNILCVNGYDYDTDMPCAYNVARSLIEAKKYLVAEISPDSSYWKWGDLMTLEYVNQPWSSTPLKPLFHRSVKSGGNECTVNVAEYHLSDAAREK